MIDYNSFLLIAAGLALIGGIVFGLYSNRIFSLSYKVENKDKNQSQNSKVKEEEKEEKEQKIAKPNILKRNFQLLEDEIKIYQFEKDLASHAIENILLASKNKSIDIFEKDRLLLKYNDQLKKLNEKMQKIQSEIDVTRLIDLRNDLASLLDNKISDIDEKIKEINLKIGTNYNIKEILTSTRNNKSSDDSKNNSNNPSSFIDIEGTTSGEEADNLINYRQLTTYKNNPIQKRKEMIIESERKKIDDLKDQVLVALDRLDQTGDTKIQEQIKDIDTKEFTEARTFLDKDPLDKDQKKQEINDKNEAAAEEEYLHIESDKKPSNTVVQNKSNFPIIFSSQGNFHYDTVTNKATTFDPSSKNSEGSLKNYVNLNPNTINASNSFGYLDSEKNNYKYNEKTPLSNILNHASPNFDHSMKSKYDQNYFAKGQRPKDNPTPLGHRNYTTSTNNNNRFKFPLAFIFSKKWKENEEGKNKKVENSIFEAHEERKDPLRNFVDKKSDKK
jgi:hypothetical protein